MIQVGFLWHMHQPSYVDPTSGVAVLPWVRLHATRAYYDMIKVALHYPGVHTTYNLVPALLEQIQLLCDGAKDRYRSVAEKPADALEKREAQFLINMFFQIDWETRVYPNPGFRRLLELRGGKEVDPAAVQRFSIQDLRDLQIWFNLAWFGFSALEEYPALTTLIEQQSGFSEKDKQIVFGVQDQILGKIIGLYRGARQKGVVDLSTTPFYHPILPLLCDTNAAGRALPNIRLPSPAFQYEEDARAQVQRAVEYHTEVFEHAPAGMWPAEGSVSPEIVPLMQEAGLEWFATSEGILCQSKLDRSSPEPVRDPEGRPSVLTPYRAGEMAVFFRHLQLSDQIGFNYGRMPGHQAASDLLNRIRSVAAKFSDPGGRPPFVPIILDGENPWEHYWDGGEAFLHNLYRGILYSDDLMGVSFTEHLETFPPVTRIRRLWSGSWIGSSYAIWAGHPEDVAGWSRLRETRNYLSEVEKRDPPPSEACLEAARRSIYAAEGSDWFWWYGEEFSSDADHEFDRLFRAHLAGVYHAFGEQPPLGLGVPIKGMNRYRRLPRPSGVVRAVIDGKQSTFYEWQEAGEERLVASGGAMARGTRLLRKLAYGFDREEVFFRIDFGRDILELDRIDPELDLIFTSPRPMSIRFPFELPDPDAIRITLLDPPSAGDTEGSGGHRQRDDIKAREMIEHHDGHVTEGRVLPDRVRAFSGNSLEIAIPRTLVHLSDGGPLEFFLIVLANGRELIRYPIREVFQLEVPSSDQLDSYWDR